MFQLVNSSGFQRQATPPQVAISQVQPVAPQVVHGSQPPPPPGGELSVGSLAQVGNHMFRITASLGHGSFSTVWTAVSVDGIGGEIAIKETVCPTQEGLIDAETEGRILQKVGGASKRIPELIAIETAPHRSGASCVRLAMTKISGDSLGAFLNNWKAQGGRMPSSDPQIVNQQFAEACHWTHEMISQLLPAFEALSPFALHRDVNTHNILVSTSGGLSAPQFGLIDFGLAIQMKNWETSCTQVPVVGDCRYWPVSGWLIFAAGGPEIMKHPHMLREYKTQLDIHAFGITALQLFIEMLPQPEGSANSAILEEFFALAHAWRRYWQDAYRFWEPLFHAFERKTDFNQLRQHYIQMNVHAVLGEDLAHLRQALSNCRDACARSDPGCKLYSFQSIFAVLLELISAGGLTVPGEVPHLCTWSTIGAIMNGTPSTKGTSTTTSHDASRTMQPMSTSTRPTLSFVPVDPRPAPLSTYSTSTPMSSYATSTPMPRTASVQRRPVAQVPAMASYAPVARGRVATW
jgi:serine/threonine protein kinase